MASARGTREALDALTTRGRAFVSAGLTALACAVLLGLRDLAAVGALLVLVPLLAAVVLVRGRHRLTLARTVTPARTEEGQPATVRLELGNEGLTRSGLMLLEEQVPYVLGPRPRFVLDRTARSWQRTLTYEVRSHVRGRFTLGPMRVRVHDPFGLVDVRRSFTSTTTVTVVPPVVPLPAIPLSGDWGGFGDNRPRDFASGSAEDVTVREYRQGDDLRRVHWRSSAHAGELMVRREGQPWQSRATATVLIDNRGVAHRGQGAASSLERAVSAAASIAMHLIGRGFHVRLVSADGRIDERSWHEHGQPRHEAETVLDTLAVLPESPRVEVDTSWVDADHHPGLLVAVLGATTGQDPRSALARLHRGGARLALVVDVEDWATAPSLGGGAEDARTLLAAHGWRAAVARREDPLPAVWRRLSGEGPAATASATRQRRWRPEVVP